jgi:hypothetical protein
LILFLLLLEVYRVIYYIYYISLFFIYREGNRIQSILWKNRGKGRKEERWRARKKSCPKYDKSPYRRVVKK